MWDVTWEDELLGDIRRNERHVAELDIGVAEAVQGVEATLFATLMSILNAGSFTGSFLGSGLTMAFGVTSTNFERLAPLITLCTLSSLLPLPLLKMIPAGSASQQVAHHEAQTAHENSVRDSL